MKYFLISVIKMAVLFFREIKEGLVRLEFLEKVDLR